MGDFTLAIATAPKRDSKTWKNGVITWDEFLGWCQTPDNKKEAGNYVFGRLNGDRRTKRTIEARSAVTLDVDFPSESFQVDVQMLDFHLVWHTTYSSTPQSPRYRIIIPLDREVSPAEYEAAARAVMDMIGLEQFDPGSIQPERYMFKPATQKPDFYDWMEQNGPTASAEELVAACPESLEALPLGTPPRWKKDPLEMPGLIGEFNRAHQDLDELIETFDLPYERASGTRWTLKGSVGAAGVGEVRPGLWYSHHANDPAFGQACSAFDLVRLHQFVELDDQSKENTPVNRLPSHLRMLEVAEIDPVTMDARWSDTVADFGGSPDTPRPATAPAPSQSSQSQPAAPQSTSGGNWRTGLVVNRAGAVTDSLANWNLIRANDPAFKVISWNKMTRSIEITGDLPWRDYVHSERAWLNRDTSALMVHLEETYRGLRVAKIRVDTLIDDHVSRNTIDPVRDYLVGLKWDGTPRIETCLPGVTPTEFTRLAARKSLVAAVARVMQPGVKWDHSLILFGSEGLGKTFWIDKMSKGWTATLGDIRSKDTLITLDRTWIVVSDEGHSLKKSDADMQKEFLTRSTDVWRAPYEAQASEHPRRCVIWGTTNDDVFLRNQEGNRRYLIVHCERQVDFDAMTDHYVDQVWAEAYHLWQHGEVLFLAGDENALATVERERFTEDDAQAGLIEEYLDMLVPADWDSMGPAGRAAYFLDSKAGMVKGTDPITVTCAAQIWYEALGEMKNPRKVDLQLIHESMKNVMGWRKLPGKRQRFQGYGPQMPYERFDPTADLEELI